MECHSVAGKHASGREKRQHEPPGFDRERTRPMGILDSIKKLFSGGEPTTPSPTKSVSDSASAASRAAKGATSSAGAAASSAGDAAKAAQSGSMDQAKSSANSATNSAQSAAGSTQTAANEVKSVIDDKTS
jgi:hypothetical protein